MRALLLFAALGALPLASLAQTAPCALVLSGRVLDEHDGQALAYAEVYIATLAKGAVADEHGRFRIEGLCAGTYRLRITHLGCEAVYQDVRLIADALIEVRLEHHMEELRELEVIQSRPDEQVGSPHRELGKKELEQAAGRSLGELLESVPGVSVAASGPTITKPVIHGLSGNRVLILNQGIRQEDQQWGTEHAPSLDPLSSDRLTVVKGAASVQYGSDAMGGVVITEPVELPREAGISGEARGSGQLNGRGGGPSALLTGGVRGLRGFGWRVQGSGRVLGDSEAARYVLSNTGLREWGASATAGYRDHRRSVSLYYSRFMRELGILRAAHIGSTTDLQRAISSGEPWYVAPFTYSIDAPRQAVVHHLLRAQAGHTITDRSRIDLSYAYQANARQEYDIRRSGHGSTPSVDLWLGTHTADAAWKHWLGKRLHGKLGVSALAQDNSNIPGTGVRPLLPDYRKASLGAYLLEHLPIGERVELEAGVRAEGTQLNVSKYDQEDVLQQPTHRFTNMAFAAGANWSIRDSVRVRFGVASAYRPPHVSELYSEGLHHGSAAIEEGDARLGNERALKATIDLESAWLRGRLKLDVTLHASRIDGFIYLRPEGTRLTVRGAFPVFRYTATDAAVSGADATVLLRLTPKLAWRLSGSTVIARDLQRDEWLFLMPSDRMNNALLYVAPKAGSWQRIEASITSQLVFEQRRIQQDLDFAPPPGTYHLMGLAFSASRAFGRGEVRIGLQASNLFNTAYRDYLDRFRYYADARGTDIVLWLRFAFGKQE